MAINKDLKIAEGRFFQRGDKALVVVGKNVAHPPARASERG